MMKRDRVKMVGSILLAGAMILVALPACGGSAEGAESIATASQTTEITPVAATETPLPAPDAGDDSDLIEQGKLLFEKTAGGVGCAFCHELDAEGGGNAPYILGAEKLMITEALNGVPAMSFFDLDDEKIKAVAAWLHFLAGQQ